MFFFNDYRLTGEANYLKNVHFKNFVIDGEEAKGKEYNSSGKGFMINLFKNCSWDNIIVKNTDGTGFGMDCPINSFITNCTAINCGKGATKNDTGASGFGIGTGYSKKESIYIYNCKAYSNTKYGFFFEHQSRFQSQNSTISYSATKSTGCVTLKTDIKGFVVSDCIAYNNLYDFGGERAYDVTYKNCWSKQMSTCISPIHFENFSVRINIINFKSTKSFSDVNNSTYEIKQWSLTNGIAEGMGNGKFGVNTVISRATAVELLYRMSGRQGNVIKSNNKVTSIGFKDVNGKLEYANAIKWANKNGIAKGDGTGNFNPNNNCTRADFIVFLYRYAGSPTTTTKNCFSDVSTDKYYAKAITWAYEKGIILGDGKGKFNPTDSCTKIMALTMLYRYSNKCNIGIKNTEKSG